MNPNMEWIAPLIAIMLVSGVGLTGLRMWLHRPQRQQGLPPETLRELTDAIDGLQEQVHALRGEMVDMNERIDFAERLLTKGKSHE